MSTSTSTNKKTANSDRNQTATNYPKVFALINSFLSYEDCVQHQILPLELREKSLLLGMVNPNNHIAIEYVLSLVKQKYTIRTQPLDYKAYQSVLDAYSQSARQSQTPAMTSPQPQERPTLIIESPEQLKSVRAKSVGSKASSAKKEAQNLSQPKTTSQLPPQLSLKTHYLSAPVKSLIHLPPSMLWQELLARVLQKGIGRLYLERIAEGGRFVWSRNGTLILSVDSLSISTFQGLLAEFKHLVDLPLAPVTQVVKGELERSYQQERLLLRWRIQPGKQGEEATLQVIRGKALELYQQRQMKELGEQALKLAQQLERKLNQIRHHRQNNSSAIPHLEVLRHTQMKIKQQLDTLE